MECLPTNRDWSASQLEKSLASWLDTKSADGLSGDRLLQWIKKGRCLLIFDGFDEVPELQQSSSGSCYPRACLLSGLIKALPTWQQRRNRVLLTSRPYGLTESERQQLGLDESPLQPLPQPLQQLFIQRWYCTTQGDEGKTIAGLLWEHLAHRSELWLADLAQNPLLLTALRIKFSEGQTLPTDQHELFDAVVENTLYNRYQDAAREILPVRRRLEVIAWGMQSGEAGESSTSDPVAEIRLDDIDRLLAQHAQENIRGESGGCNAAQRRDELQTRSGLLQPLGTEQAEFYHRMFQDFFAAEYLLRRPQLSITKLLEKHAANEDWHTLFIFLLSGLYRRGSGIDGPLNDFGSILRPQLESSSIETQALPAILWGRCLELAQKLIADLGPLGEEFFCACEMALEVVTKPSERARLFDSLARLGLDRRPGVGLTPAGLPDIAWQVVPAGEFIYGDDIEQRLYLDAFRISRYPITNSQYQCFIDDPSYSDARWWQGLGSIPQIEPEWREANRPREHVNWHQAMAYCRWLSERLGEPITLPTEQQWERAARGKDGSVYPWGDDYVAGQANINEKRFNQGPTYLEQTSAVGLYPTGASPDGVHDLAGNLWEWCDSRYDETSDDKVGACMFRGGSWYDNWESARSAIRSWGSPVHPVKVVGFRVLCSGTDF